MVQATFVATEVIESFFVAVEARVADSVAGVCRKRAAPRYEKIANLAMVITINGPTAAVGRGSFAPTASNGYFVACFGCGASSCSWRSVV